MTDSKKDAKPKCPKCGSLALTAGLCTKTNVCFPRFTDEAGNWHTHDRNTTTCQYTCRKCGHSFSESSRGSCWCGWKA